MGVEQLSSTTDAQAIMSMAQQTANKPVANASGMSREKIKETAQQFESMFLSQMLSYMMPKMDTDNPFNGGKGEEVFKSFMTNEYASIMAKTGKTGISQMVEREMIRMQEAAQQQTGL